MKFLKHLLATAAITAISFLVIGGMMWGLLALMKSGPIITILGVGTFIIFLFSIIGYIKENSK